MQNIRHRQQYLKIYKCHLRKVKLKIDACNRIACGNIEFAMEHKGNRLVKLKPISYLREITLNASNNSECPYTSVALATNL